MADSPEQRSRSRSPSPARSPVGRAARRDGDDLSPRPSRKRQVNPRTKAGDRVLTLVNLQVSRVSLPFAPRAPCQAHRSPPPGP